MRDLFDIDSSSLRGFFAHWYGSPDQEPSTVAGSELPPPLLDWYAAVSAYSHLLTSQNRVLPPGELIRAGDKLIFWLENQHVAEWAVDATGDDPWVYERATGVEDPWHPVGVRLSAFLVSVAVFEAVMTAQESVCGADLTAEEMTAALAPLRPLPVPGPTASGQLYASDGTESGRHIIAFATPESPDSADRWWVWIAAQDESSLGYLAQITDRFARA